MFDFYNTVVPKPWGSEYLIYQNENVAVWILNVKFGQKTSLHCHPNKKTGLVILQGGFRLSFLNDGQNLLPGDKLMIHRGVFHSSHCASGDGMLLEIETPVDKEDIIRIKDEYGRVGSPYESERISTEIDYNLKNRVLGECLINQIEINKIEDIPENSTLVGLEGAIFNKNCNVWSTGDISNSKTLANLYSQFQTSPLKAIQIQPLWK